MSVEGTKPYRVGKIRRIDGKQNRTEAAALWNSTRSVQFVRGIITNYGDLRYGMIHPYPMSVGLGEIPPCALCWLPS
ncbi:hypothetical protein J6590_089687 [Homalodisca vitripennis]|nr:hypothetical protein J6590_089687 [Homalodisca vitripennis]